MKSMKRFLATAFSLLFTLGIFVGCGPQPPQPPPSSASGVKKAQVRVQAGSDGLTAEQRNISDRLKEDNKPGAIKHLYVISSYSGQVILYSTVRGKVTSGGKRLTPYEASTGGSYGEFLIPEVLGRAGTYTYTNELVQDDGTYGHSMDYLYWWDARGVSHQHYVTGGQIVHISNQPIATKGIILNLELSNSTN